MPEGREAGATLAPAKINLFLHVTGRRADGYHLLDSIFLYLDLADRLIVETAPPGTLELVLEGPWGKGLERDMEGNLVLKAARALMARVDPPSGVRMTLEKAIPVAAGLGGGSSDAAAALKALVRLWNVDIDAQALLSLALGLGADVPACLAPRPQRIGGIGEELTPLSAAPDWGVVLVNPRVAVPTAGVFAAFREARPEFRARLPERINWQDIDWLRAETSNDLEAPARALAPPIGAVLDSLATSPGCRLARMSGSGATCFGLYDSAATAAAAAQEIRGAHGDWWIFSGGFHPPS